ncbi:MAG TPA: hypothetical protein VFU73_11460 [Actinocrinis sp.]|nr:hypothetical protein [Actinocrinis sp.]
MAFPVCSASRDGVTRQIAVALAEAPADEGLRIDGCLRGRAVRLSSNGPVGDPPAPDADSAVHVKALMEASGARGHHLFGDTSARSHLSPVERMAAAALRLPDADRREWDESAAWRTRSGASFDPRAERRPSRRRLTDA